MATKITAPLEYDLDGAPAVETVRFAVGGAEYEIDLHKMNAAAFRKQLAPFIEHASRAGRGPRRRAGRSAAGRGRGVGPRPIRGRRTPNQTRGGLRPGAFGRNTGELRRTSAG
jgi:hypothetical protein